MQITAAAWMFIIDEVAVRSKNRDNWVFIVRLLGIESF